MDLIAENIKDCIYYNPDKKVYERYSNIRTKDNKHAEFIHIIKSQFGRFDPDDWDTVCVDHNDYDAEYDDSQGNMCICSHNIHDLCFIKHKETNQIFQVGSKCVSKISPKLGKKLHEISIRNRNIELNNICTYCREPLFDMRKKYQKDFFCNRICFEKMKYVIPFGKYIGKVLVEVMCTYDGVNYINNFIKKEIEKDPTSFIRFPFFLEIIEENDLELE